MIEQLETRRFMSVTTTVSSGTLKITGDSAANDIKVTFDSGSGKYTVTADASSKEVQTAQVIKKISLNGGNGSDRLEIDQSVIAPTTISGGSGNDTMIGGHGNDNLNGDSGIDTADYSQFNEDLMLTLDGKANDGRAGEFDNINSSTENIIAGGNDRLVGNSSANTLDGGAGADYIDGGSGNDSLIGGSGKDFMLGGNGNDRLIGLDGEMDIMLGGSGLNTGTYDGSDFVML